MGLREWFSGITDGIDGQYQLTSCSVGTGGAAYSNCSMSGVVTAPGIAPTAVAHTSLLTPTSKWPQPGQVLPITVSRSTPSKLRIRWDLMPTNHERAMQAAQAAAQQAAQQQGGQYGAPQYGAAGSYASTPGAYPASAADTSVPTHGVLGDPSRPLPGGAGGGLTPEESAAAASNPAAAGLQQAFATVLAVHPVPMPPGAPDPAPAGTVDLTLDVRPTTGTGYTTRMRIGFSTPQRRAAIATVGLELPVLADPNAQDRIAVDTSRLRLP